MDKKSKILLWVFFLLIVGSVSVTFWRIVIKKDYIIEAQADCDPTMEKCFVAHCDPATETTCTGDEEKDTTYFKKVKRVAANIPLCDPADESCKPLVCGEREKDCEVAFCDEQTKGKDDECNDPEQYNVDHPAVDEAASDETATCDLETDPTCVDSASSADESDVTNAATAGNAPVDNSDATVSQ